ncbi:hypothetical protein M5Y63_01645 [Neisseria meningitidis]|uniref:hypothetical protein n=1 Tax=Neisseria meningitidis TaxID=487 RepID=UPI001F0C1DDE|nr:hypothetical protein [Neisseria meningitidis]MCL4977804.1 hypothetical protein [Neisseria meningitidis]MCL4998186.1 hypothetical protein [Neisseria meningitidis]MCL5764442.1 hypothetical protein [Neisseria meningitidis]MCL5864017.1 hypothetical protein [Neisseria meningitidis]MCL5915982.1 hypothetical protein [Neisseria meningitidis]
MPSEVGFGGFRRFHTAGMRLHQNKIPPAFPICPPRFLQNKPPAPLLQKAVRHSEYPVQNDLSDGICAAAMKAKTL